MPKHQHSEAFCLMKYISDDKTETEMIWNSRDGVTPFVITLKSGKQATHTEWSNDQYLPDYKPKPGERIFVDMTEERRKELTLANCQRYWPNAVGVVEIENEYSDMARSEFKSAEAMAEFLLREPMRPGEPDLIEVKE